MCGERVKDALEDDYGSVPVWSQIGGRSVSLDCGLINSACVEELKLRERAPNHDGGCPWCAWLPFDLIIRHASCDRKGQCKEMFVGWVGKVIELKRNQATMQFSRCNYMTPHGRCNPYLFLSDRYTMIHCELYQTHASHWGESRCDTKDRLDFALRDWWYDWSKWSWSIL